MATKYQTTIPVQLVVQPDMKGYVLVEVLVDDSGYAVAGQITSKDVKPKINAAQARAALHCRRLVDYDKHVDYCWSRRGHTPSNHYYTPIPSHQSGIEWSDQATIRPLFLNRVTNRATHEQVNPNDRPMAMIYWYIYRLDAAGLAFERVAAQYP